METAVPVMQAILPHRRPPEHGKDGPNSRFGSKSKKLIHLPRSDY